MTRRGLGWWFASVMIVVCSGIAHGATIRRLSPPTPLESPATVTVDVGSRVGVSCSEPGGTVQWYGPDGEPVVTGDGVRVVGSAPLQVLVFTSYQSSQGGQYECRSSKDGTKDTQIVRFVSPVTTTWSTTSPWTSSSPPAKMRVPQKVGPPVLTKAVRSGRPALTVTWTAPQSERPITKYQVQYRRTGTTSWSTRDVRTRSVTLENLSPGTSYQVQVRAVSDVGNGPFSDVRTLFTYRVPLAVDRPTVTQAAVSGRPALRVSWSRPQSDLPITRYEVQYRVTGSGISGWKTVPVTGPNPSPRTLSPLDGGARYDVRIRAVSAVGGGNYSPTRIQTATRVPSAVDIPTVTQAAVSGRPALRVSWRAPQSDLPITRYEVQYRVTGSGNSVWKTVPVTGPNPSPRTLSPLVGGTRYDIRVRAVSAVGGGNYSPTRTQTAPRLPSTVDIPTVTQAAVSGRPALRVSWSRPQSDLPITRYEVQYRVPGSGNSGWRTVPVTGPNPSPRTISPLVAGTRYDVQVRAVSAVGGGNYSPTRTQTTPRVPSAVDIPTVTQAAVSGRPALRVLWRAPQSDLPITRYEVQYRVTGSGNSVWKTVPVTGPNPSPRTLSPLVGGTRYDIRVRAVSAVGGGNYSPTQTQTTPRVPSAVIIPTVTQAAVSGRPALRVSWRAPQSDLPITRYEVQYRVSGSGNSVWKTVQVTGPNPSPRTISPLVGGTRYDIRVRAVSTVGVGNYSSTRTQTAPRVSSAVGIPTVTQAAVSGRPALRVSWRAPQSDFTITRYEVQYKVTGSGNSGWRTIPVTGPNPSPRTISPLVGGTRYDIRVRAVSAVGGGNYSPTRTQTAPRVPQKVLTKAVRSGRPALTVTWTAPQSDRPITKYQVQYRRTGTTSWSTRDVRTISVTLENLSPGTSYQVQVRAISDVGSGPFSDVRTISTFRVPQQVTGVDPINVTKGNLLILTITWTRPSSELPITHYEVEYKEDNVVQPTVRADDEIVVVHGTVGRTYSVRVRAVSAAGNGPWSDSESPKRQSNINFKVVNYPNSFTVNWDKMSEFHYRVYIRKWNTNEGNTFTAVLPPYNITGLESNTRYSIVVEAYNSLGGNNGSIASVTAPEAPGRLKLQVLSSTAIKVSWTPPSNADRLPLTYHVSYSSEFTSSTSKSTEEQSLDLTGLHPFDVYTVTVEAENSGGKSTAASTSATTFMSTPMLTPKSLTHASKNSRSVVLNWSIPPRIGRNGIILQYAVRLYVTESTPQTRVRSVRNFTVVINNPTFDEPTTSQYTLTTLTPHTHYGWRVAAVNDAGMGPFSALNSFWTLQDVPGPVSNLSYSITSNTSAKITWSEPTEPNGVITGYVMEYGVYEGNKTNVNFRKDVSATSLKNLTPKRPVQVTVSAKTIVGMGQTVSKVFFTSEGTPTAAVQNVAIKWVNDNSAVHVSWTPLTLHEARGFPLYVVTYYPSSLGRVSRDTNRATTTNSSVVIGGLDPTTSYSFMVDVYTGNGTMKGNATAGLHVLLPPRVSSDNSGVIGGTISAVSFVFMVIMAIVITIICVVIIRKRHCHDANNSCTAKEVEYESVQLENNPAYGAANIYEEIK